ncbi:hypothetical protein GCM10022377_10580 [Zhihengliuella alba]|uniref:EccD-like transmembrane domain-containing protein n=2 Tax=Zhihengliuella alba TaxID=547018 RepID=A0ABP7D592_9MICC
MHDSLSTLQAPGRDGGPRRAGTEAAAAAGGRSNTTTSVQPYTRVTLVGERRRLDLVLPSTAEIGTLMPQILRLLGDTPGERVASKILLTDTGAPLPAHTTLAEAGVADGAVLSLHNNYDAPPPAVVYDVTDAVVDESERTASPWTRTHLLVASGVAAGLGVLLGLWTLTSTYAGGRAWWILLAVGAALLVTGAALVRTHRPVSATLQVLGAVVAALGVWNAGWLPVGVAALAAALVGTLLIGGLAPLAPRPPAVYATAGVAGGLTALWAAAALLSVWAVGTSGAEPAAADPLVGTAAIAGIGSVAALGLLPTLALNASGLARLDDLRAQGAEIARGHALDAIRAAHSALRWSTVVAAASVGAALVLLASGGPADDARAGLVWTVPLALVLAAATGLRARSFPLAVQRYALYAAAVLGVVATAARLAAAFPERTWLVAVVLVVLGVLAGLGLVTRLAEHTQARLRQLASRVEALTALASVPLAVGYFGVFHLLLNSF